MPELAYTGSSFTETAAKGQMMDIIDACRSSAIFGSRVLGHQLGPRPPSVVAHDGVRTAPLGVTRDGREFNHPYKKRVNCMLSSIDSSLSEEDAETFAQRFGELAQQVVLDRDLLLVIQMLVGGGKAATNGIDELTGIPYRNLSFLFVFDVFYKNPEAATKAVEIQDELQKLLDEVGGGCFNHRSFWGSFGRENGETDMADAAVQKMYYGSADAYAAMQKIKDRVDPKGVFATEFTVQNSQP
jgi:hypothetical protein